MTTIGRTTSTPERLTPRQREVLELLRRGDTNEEIARSLGISLDGAKWHVSEIIGRLGVTDRYEAARWRPEGERRPWWSLAWFRDLGWPTAAKAASVAALAIVTIAIIALTWGIWRGNDDKASIAPASPPVPRMMVLSVSADGGAIAVDTDTGGVTQRLDVKDVGGWISPDGTRSAFTCAEYPAANTRATDPAWCMWDSATGLSVAVSRSELARRGLLEDGNGGPNFVWSADGTKFAFFVYQGAGVSVNNSVDVYVKDLLSGDLRMVHQATLTQGHRRFIGFSPDGKHIGMYDGPASLLIIDIDTNAEHILSDALAIGAGQLRFGSAAWSPDSRTIAFVVNQGLYVAFADGSSPALRIAGEWAPGWLEWSPDGHWIAATRVNEERDPVVFSHAVIVRPDGTDERDIDGNLALSSYPSWSPKRGRLPSAVATMPSRRMGTSSTLLILIHRPCARSTSAHRWRPTRSSPGPLMESACSTRRRPRPAAASVSNPATSICPTPMAPPPRASSTTNPLPRSSAGPSNRRAQDMKSGLTSGHLCGQSLSAS